MVYSYEPSGDVTFLTVCEVAFCNVVYKFIDVTLKNSVNN